MSVPKAAQSLICGGKRWAGIAFGDSLTCLDAAGPKGTKDVDGAKVFSMMLMAAPGLDGAEEVSKWERNIQEARELVAALPGPSAEETKKAALLSLDLLVKASQGLDNMELVGAQRERRKALLAQIEALEKEVEERKSRI
mmetsp:Transcript_35035/g.63130  ORF Transcript_35035/g.63130 Transcript_35035/m.63130 type:complete len:140 (-) Transcript_35035:38-457(-)